MSGTAHRILCLVSRTALRHSPHRHPYLRLPPWRTFPRRRRLLHHRPRLPLFPLPPGLLSAPSIDARRLSINAALPLRLTRSPHSLLLHRMHPYVLAGVAIPQSPLRSLPPTRLTRLLSGMRYTSPLQRYLRRHLLLHQPPQSVHHLFRVYLQLLRPTLPPLSPQQINFSRCILQG
jgi:hypothetical protein